MPASWRQLDPAPTLAGLKLRDAVAGDGGSPAPFVAGRADGEGPTLLPPAFLRSLGESPKGEAVRLGSAGAYRYTDLRRAGEGEPVTVFTVPMEADVATVACSGADAKVCDAAAASLTVPNQRERPLGPSKGYAKAVRGVLGSICGTGARPGSVALTARVPRRARRPRRRQSRPHRRPLQATRTVPTGPYERAATGRLADALERTAVVWERLAAAARSGSRRRYADARRAIVTADRNASRSVAALRALGGD